MKARIVVLILAAAATLLQASNTGAQTTNPSYLREMPTVERVKAEIKGTDAIDTAARQAGAFWQLRDVIYKMALSQHRNDRQVTPDEKRLADAYYAAWYSVWQPVQKALAQDRPRLFKLEGYTADPGVLSEVLERLCSPAFRAEYYKAVGMVDTRKQIRKEAARAEQAQAQAEWQQLMKQGQLPEWKRKLARCIAAGRSESQCFSGQIGGEVDGYLSSRLGLNLQRPAGLIMNGVYAAPGGLMVAFGPRGAHITCKAVSASANYAVRHEGGQILVRLLDAADEWQGQRVVLPVRPDGRLSGTGLLKVTGQVVVGHKKETVREKKEIAEYEVSLKFNVKRDHLNNPYVEEDVERDVPIYAPKTEQCALGVLAPTKAATGPAVLAAIFGSADNFDPVKLPAPGLRMTGTYAGQGGFEVEFHLDSAVLGCREAVVARDYSVSASGGRVLVNIQNGGAPLALELRPDGALAGAGQVQVSGRVMVGSNRRVDENTRMVTHDPVFQPVSDTCSVGVLTPAQGASAGAGTPAGTGGSAPAAARQPVSPPAVWPSNAPAASTPAPLAANAVLTVNDGFAVPPGTPSPFAGQIITLWKESWENIIRKAGVRPPAGTSAVKVWLNACASGQPLCQQVIAFAGPFAITNARFSAGRQTQFPAVPPGTYYVFGAARHNNQPFMWDVRVDLKPGANAVTLNQRNTTPIN